jgi:hypothetical protein
MNPENMNEEQLDKFLLKRGFEEDEIKTLFPTEEKKREAVAQTMKLAKVSEKTEKKLGWDKTDDTKLKDSQKAIVKEKRDRREGIEKELKKKEAELKKVSKKADKEADKELVESIQETGAEVTPTEVKSAMADLKALMADDDDDESDEE